MPEHDKTIELCNIRDGHICLETGPISIPIREIRRENGLRELQPIRSAHCLSTAQKVIADATATVFSVHRKA